MVTPCPLCHLSLDAWQSKLKKQTGKDFQMPILHLSQLIGVAAGLSYWERRFKRHVVSMQPVVEKLALSRRHARLHDAEAPRPRGQERRATSRAARGPPS